MITEKEIKTAASSKKLLLGYRTALRAAKLGKVKKVVIASNCPSAMKSALLAAGGEAKISIETFDGDSADLGATCGKPFKVTVAAFL